MLQIEVQFLHIQYNTSGPAFSLSAEIANDLCAQPVHIISVRCEKKIPVRSKNTLLLRHLTN